MVVHIEKQARLLPARPSLDRRQHWPETKNTLTAQWVWFVSLSVSNNWHDHALRATLLEKAAKSLRCPSGISIRQNESFRLHRRSLDREYLHPPSSQSASAIISSWSAALLPSPVCKSLLRALLRLEVFSSFSSGVMSIVIGA
jgi:hypothetical protein